MKKNKTKRYTVNLDYSLASKLEKKAEKDFVSIAHLLRQLVVNAFGKKPD